jgi:uncharacterized protein (TIGR03435 family)
MRTVILLVSCLLAARGQSFDVASVKPSARYAGKDYRPAIEVMGGRFQARNASLKDLILAAYHADRYQVAGGPGWLDEDEFDVDARADGNASPDQIRMMLRTLLADRFKLVMRTEQKEMRRYDLVVDRGGPKIHPAKEGDARGRFHGDLRQFANLLSIQLSIPSQAIPDPTKPSIATGPPVPVIDKTGLAGVYDINASPQRELGGDSFVTWQRILQDQLGLRLESQKGPLDVMVVVGAEKARGNE